MKRFGIVAAAVLVILLGVVVIKVDKKETVIETYTKTIKANPNNAVAYNDRGKAYSHQRKYDKAILDFTRAIEIDPKYAAPYNNRGNAYQSMGNLEKAILEYTKAIEIGSNLAPTYRNRGDAYYNQGKYDEAMSDYSVSIGIAPKYAAAYNGRGRVHGKRSNFDEAISDFTKAIEINSKDVGFYINRGSAYCQKNQYDKGLSDFNCAIEADPKEAEAYNLRAIVYYFKREYDKAMNDVHKAEELGFKVNPNLLEALKRSSEENNSAGAINISANTKFVKTDDIIFALSPQAGTVPREDVLYALDNMEVMQTLNDGVLMRINPALYEGIVGEPAIAFLYTNENFVDDTYLRGYWAYYVGTYKYQTVLGSGKNVYAFKLYAGPVNRGRR